MVMKTKYPVTYEGHPIPPSTGDMLVWDGSEWVLLTRSYDTLSAPTGNPATTTWDCETGLNKKISISSAFTLSITNVLNGMSGHVVVNNTTKGTTITLEASTAGAIPSTITVIGNGVLTELNTGVHNICWVYDGTRLTFNIARYADTI